MQQNPLFPSSGNPSNGQLPDYLQTGAVTPHIPQDQQPQPQPYSQPQPQVVQPSYGQQNAPASPQPLAGQQFEPTAAIQPQQPIAITQNTAEGERNVAADLIRQKVAALYAQEPSSAAEMQDIAATPAPLSKHQQFMQGLQQSGRSFAEIQTAWHEYYNDLSDAEKYEVWQEHYNAAAGGPARQAAAMEPSSPQAGQGQITPSASTSDSPRQSHGATVQPLQRDAGHFSDSSAVSYQAPQPSSDQPQPTQPKPAQGSIQDIKKKILDTVNAKTPVRHRDFFRSLGFGLACGAVVLLIFMFSFFNEIIISPFIQPPRHAIETPVIVDPANSVAAGKNPEVIIPKINVQIPVDYSQTTTNEAAIETALDSAVVHYPTTVQPGQTGNAAFFGHSSNNIFNPGKYKFAFVLLHKLTNGDTFYLTRDGKTYAYEVISSRIVKPTEVGVLGPVEGQTATATLITCDPPGTSINRLVVVGKQISPDPAGNTAPSDKPATPVITASETNLPGNGPTLFSRLWNNIF